MLFKGLAYSSLLFGILLPLNTNYSNIILILFYFLCGVFIFSSKKNELSFKYINLYQSTVLLVLPILISLIFLGLEGSVLQMLGRRITLLISPIILFSLPKKVIEELRKKAGIGLILGSFFTSGYLIFTVLKKYFLEKGTIVIDKDLFNYYHTNANFMSDIDIHPSYYGIYVLVALLFLQIEKPIKNQFIKIAIYIVFSLSLIFLNSRVLLFLFILFILWVISKEIIGRLKSKKQKLFTVVIFTLGFFLFFMTLKNTYIYHKFSKELVWDLSNQVGTKYNSKNQGDSRVARWKTAMDVVIQKPFFGYGAGNETETLRQEYLKREMGFSARAQYNSHNQYITTLIEGGVFAFSFFIVFFICNLYLAWNKSDILFLFFLISIMTISIVESYFNRNAGISFFSFFSTIFLLSNGNSKG